MKTKNKISLILSTLLITSTVYANNVSENNIWKNNVDKNIQKLDNLDKEFDTPLKIDKNKKAVEGNASWSLVNKDCNPELNIDGAYKQMFNMYLKSFKKSLDPKIWKTYLMNKTLDWQVEYMAQVRCSSSVGKSIVSPVNQKDLHSKIIECQNKNNKGLVKTEQGTTQGTQLSSDFKVYTDESALAFSSTCVGTVYGKKEAELYDKCMVEEKKNILDFFNGRVKAGIDQANIDLQNQQNKCILDSQNREHTLQSIIGNGWKTKTDGDKVSLVLTNSVDENIEDSTINRNKSLHLASSVSKSMVGNDSFSQNSSSDVLGYSVILYNWSVRVFKTNCDKIKYKTDGIEIEVPNCRWDDKTIGTLTPNDIDEMSNSAKSKVSIMEECQDISKLNPLFIPEPNIVMLENGKDSNDNNVKGAKNRFEYFLKVDKGWNQKNISMGDGTKFNTLKTHINKITKLIESTEYAQRTICRDWAIDYRNSINERIIKVSNTQGANEALGGKDGKGITDKTDKLRHAMETKSNERLQAKLKRIDDLIEMLDMRLSNTDKRKLIRGLIIN